MVAIVTIMVNNRNSYCCRDSDLPDPPSRDDPDVEDRTIQSGPIWDLNELVEIAARTGATDSVHVVTKRAETDLEALEETGFDLQEVMMLLPINGKFKGSAWCKSSPATDRFGNPRGKGFWFPCDAYTVVASTIHPSTGYSSTAEYYLKMAKGLNGTFVVFVSIHLSH